MPTSFKHEGDDRVVIDNRTGEVIADAITAQTSAYTGPSYTAPRRGLFGRRVIKTIQADIRIATAFERSGARPIKGDPARLHNPEATRGLVHRG